ncbi:Na(+)/H(+) antiporter subunit D [Wenzhouxiangella sp. XN79A]|uniref:Na(+)/H(+) antiporter subunit D n=1 Tax=Wenzhouxiangella sp. XN79A TaxID=2724193 RepID=UPI00144ADEF3|nr:Na(+)/H(+) antiporter subunit D [Wenzhouxiangella sp. XN79A]NKI34934.1 Na(+)/H(+) antiporter subunit D [Wenzhouxiangella sp. XN79A]
MLEFVLPPAFLMMFGAVLLALSRPALRPLIALATPLVTLYFIWQVGDGVQQTVTFLGYEVQLVEGSNLRRLFATVFALMAFGGALFAFRQSKWWELSAALLYAAGAIGVSFAGDLIVMFLFWELMALFSTVVVWCGGTERARAAGIRYAIIHLLGGLILKIGIEGLMIQTGSIEIRALTLDDFNTWMIFIGVLINAAAPPVSAWLADAYPESSPMGGVFLSAFTTKTAVLSLILLFPGQPLLIWIGLYMVFYGIIYALLENDMRRILSYSIVNQVGFMVVGVGIGTELALNGAAAHAFTHIIYKALLFMSAGAVLYRTGESKCSNLGGLFRTMPLTATCGIIGALAISSFPFTSGFISKSMISSSAAGEQLALVWFLLVAASAGVFLHAGIKFPWFVFFQKDSGLRPKEAPWNMRLAMILFAVACIGLGVFPNLLYGLLPYPVDYVPYTADHVITQLQLLLFAGLAFFVLLPLMKRTDTVSLDVDWLWRRGLPWVMERSDRAITGLRNLTTGLAGTVGRLLYDLMREKPYRYFSSRSPMGQTAIWMAVLLAVVVLLAMT